MAIVNTNTAPILKEGSNITLSQVGQTITITSSAGSAAGGDPTEVQYNSGGALEGDPSFTYNDTTNVVSLESVDFATTPAAADAERRLKWDNDEGSLVLTLKGGNITIPIGAEVVSLVYNAEATTLTKGTVVYAFGASGQRVSVKKAVNTADATSAQTFGVIAESIAAGAEGFCMVQGMVRGIDTSAYVQGDTLYLSATAGQFTKTKPVSPNHLVYIGFAVKINASSGEIFVRPQNGYEFSEIHDYLEGSVQNNDVISYESSSGLYKPKSIPTLLGYTPMQNPMSVVGDIIYGGASGTPTRLAGRILTSRAFLSSVGDGTNSTAPTWRRISLASDVDDALGYSQGGTGLTSLGTAYDYLRVNAAGTALEYASLGAVGSTGLEILDTYGIKWVTTLGGASNARISFTNTSGMAFYSDGVVTPTMFLSDDGNRRVGIGTTTPSYLLDISSSSDPILGLYRTTNSIGFGIGRINWDGQNSSSTRVTYGRIQTEIASNTAGSHSGNLIFYTAGSGTVSSRMIISGDGNLGLGVTPSAWGSPFKALEGGDGDNQQYIGFQTNANDLKIGTNNYYDGANYVYKFNGTATRYDVSNSSFAWNLAGSGTAGNAISFTQAMTLNASGQLAIGTTSNAWGSSFKSIQIGTGLSALSDSSGRATYLSNNWYYDTGDKYMAAYQATLYYQYLGAHAWLTAGTGSAGAPLTWTQAMTLDSSGRLGIGSSATSPTATLQIGTGIGTFDGLAIGGAANRDIRIGQSSTNNLVLAWKYNATAASAYALIETFGGSNNLILQGTGGNVGINTTTPSYKLDVNGTGRFSGLLTANSFNATDADPYLVINQTTNTNNSGIKFQTNTTEIGKITAQGSNGQMNINMGVSSGWGGYITFSTDNSEKMRLDASGNLGLGAISTPGNRFWIKGSSTSNSDSSLFIQNSTPSPLMIVRNDGKVGIFTDSPAYNLDVNGSIGTSGSLSLLNGSNSSLYNEIYFSDNGQIRSKDDNHRIIFDRANNNLELREYGNIIFSAGSTTGTRTDSMRITSGGNVGINTTSPSYKLDVNGTFAFRSTGYAYDSTLYAYNSSTNKYLQFTTDSTGGLLTMTDTTTLRLQTNGGSLRTGGSFGVNVNPHATAGRIDASNDIVAYSSDKRLKRNVKEIEDALYKIQKLQGFTYNWNDLAKEKAGFDTDINMVGLFAQDVQEVLPEAVKLAPFDNNGNDESISGENYLTVQYDKLVPLLIEAIKDLNNKYNQLKNGI